MRLADILPILETGQMLVFIEVKSGDVSITEKGYLVLAAGPRQQKFLGHCYWYVPDSYILVKMLPQARVSCTGPPFQRSISPT